MKINRYSSKILFLTLLMGTACRPEARVSSSVKADAVAEDCGPPLSEASNEPIPAGRGMEKQWEEIQAEDASIIIGKIIGPCRKKWDAAHIESEAIGRKAVVIDPMNFQDSITFVPTRDFNSIVVRYSIPDGQADVKLTVIVGSASVGDLTLSSKNSWSYKGGLIGDPSADSPAEDPHTFFDEARLRFGGGEVYFPAYSQVTLKFTSPWDVKIGGILQGLVDGLAQGLKGYKPAVVIDLADFEKVPGPESMPDGFTNVKDLGIVPNDGVNHGDDIEQALREHKKLWFPAGDYKVDSFTGSNIGIDCHNCEIQGAGMWYTNFLGRSAMFFCIDVLNEADSGSPRCVFRNFSIIGDSKVRAEEAEGAQKGFAGPMGVDSLIENIWIEHTVAGIWVGNDPPNQRYTTSGLKIRNCRVRNVYADGINLANGTSNTLVENCHIRNSGDDGIAIWSVKWTDWVKEKTFSAGPDVIRPDGKNAPDQGVGHDNTFRKITVQMPWRADCFAVYGGYNNTIEDSVCQDVLTYPGILVDNEFSPYDFGPGLTTFRNISLIRAGGPMFYERSASPWTHGAMKFYMREGSVNDILAENIDIIDPLYSGIEFRGFGTQYVRDGEKFEPGLLASAEAAEFRNVTLRNVRIVNPGTYGIEVSDGGGRGQVNLEGVTVLNPQLGFMTDAIPNGFFNGAPILSGSPVNP